MSATDFWSTKLVYSTYVAIDLSTAIAASFTPGEKVFVTRIIYITTIAHTVADATITVAVQNADGTSSTTIGTHTLPFTGSAINQIQYVDLVKAKTAAVVSTIDGSTTYFGGTGGVAVNPGQKLNALSDGGGTVGSYLVYFEYARDGFNERRLSAAGVLTQTERPFTAV